MNKFLTDILMTLDGKRFHISKVLWVVGVLVYLILSTTAVIMGQPWNPAQYGIGFGAVLAGGGVAMKLNKEPDSTENSSNTINM